MGTMRDFHDFGFLKKFLTLLAPSLGRAAPFEKISKTLILAFEANSALSHENETKIVKITHSDGQRFFQNHQS